MLRPEQMLLVPTDVEATYQQRKGVRFYWLYFRADYAGAVDLFRLAPPRRLLRSGGKRAASQFRQLIRGFRRQDLSSRLSSTAILVEFLVPFLKGAAPVRTGVVAIQRLLPVLRYIDEHLREEITNDDLARLLYLSPKYFCNLFSAATGVPPVAYIHQRRVLRAKERLLLSSETIKSIAVKVGFRDPLYFARVFRRLEGVSPREYRARYLRPQ
jgi:AraC-like DNA-binding protein